MTNEDIIIKCATVENAEEILKLQKLGFLSEAAIYDDYSVLPLKQTLKEIREDFKEYTSLNFQLLSLYMTKSPSHSPPAAV